jgi:hypothetical protein
MGNNMGIKPEEIEEMAIADKEHKYARYEDVDKEQLEKDRLSAPFKT